MKHPTRFLSTQDALLSSDNVSVMFPHFDYGLNNFELIQAFNDDPSEIFDCLVRLHPAISHWDFSWIKVIFLSEIGDYRPVGLFREIVHIILLQSFLICGNEPGFYSVNAPSLVTVNIYTSCDGVYGIYSHDDLRNSDFSFPTCALSRYLPLLSHAWLWNDTMVRNYASVASELYPSTMRMYDIVYVANVLFCAEAIATHTEYSYDANGVGTLFEVSRELIKQAEILWVQWDTANDVAAEREFERNYEGWNDDRDYDYDDGYYDYEYDLDDNQFPPEEEVLFYQFIDINLPGFHYETQPWMGQDTSEHMCVEFLMDACPRGNTCRYSHCRYAQRQGLDPNLPGYIYMYGDEE